MTGVANAGIKLERGVSGILAGIAGMRRVPKVVQTGGLTLQPGTIRILNEQNGVDFRPDQWHQAIEELKDFHRIPKNHHGKIFDNGDYADDAGQIIGNLFEFTP